MKQKSSILLVALVCAFSSIFSQVAEQVPSLQHPVVNSLTGDISYYATPDAFRCLVGTNIHDDMQVYSVSHIFMGRTSLVSFELSALHYTQNEASAHYTNDQVGIQLIGSSTGVRHNIYVYERPNGNDQLRVLIPVETPYLMAEQSNAVQFMDSITGETVLEVSNLMVWDAEYNPVPATIHTIKEPGMQGWEIELDDSRAIYPLTIDPLSHTPVWRKVGNYNDIYGAMLRGPGDINNDGYDDILVSGFNRSTGSGGGKVNLYLGSPTGPSTTPEWEFIGGQGGANVGKSLTAGDVNGDGYLDIFCGSPDFDTYQLNDGVVFGFYYTPEGILPDPDWFATSYLTESKFGYVADASGDINNDGYDDLVVGAYGMDKIYLYMGSPDGLPWEPSDSIIEPFVESQFFGQHLVVTEINGDGYSDLVVRNYDIDTYSPAILVFYGTATGISHDIGSTAGGWGKVLGLYSAGDVNGDGLGDIVTNEGDFDDEMSHLYLGSTDSLVESCWYFVTTVSAGSQSIYAAGDVNGDTYGDVLIYSDYAIHQLYPPAGTDVGSSILLFTGSADGLADFPAWWDASSYIAGAGDAGDDFEYQVSSAGDVNGDGYDDFLVSNPWKDVIYNEGEVELYYGDRLEYELIYNENYSYRGNASTQKYGSSITNLGDINDDGYDDVIIGRPNYTGIYSNQGKVEIFQGTPTGLDLLPIWSYVGSNANATLGWTTCAPGDITGDGIADLLVYEEFRTAYPTDYGYVMLFKGTDMGFETTPAQTWSGTFNLGYFGLSMKGVGDINADGINDFAVSEKGYDGGQTDEGRILLFYGASPLPSLTPAWTFENNVSFQKLDVIAGTGDINNDGFDDLAIGSPTFNGLFPGGIVYVFYGSAVGLPTTPSWQRAGMGSGMYYGETITNMGDLNGDGFGDLAIGTGSHGYGLLETGTFIDFFYGTASGLPVDPTLTIMDDTLYFLQRNPTPIGDFNGDGYTDFAITSTSQFRSTIAYNFPRTSLQSIYSGSPEGILPQKLFISNPFDNNAGDGFVHPGGDINGDGFDDYFVAVPDIDEQIYGDCPDNTYNINSPGKIFLYFGRSNDCTSATAPTLVSATTTSLHIQWTADAFTDYNFIRYRAVGAPVWVMDSSNSNTLTVTGLLPCTAYEVQVQSFCTDGAASWSPLVTLSTTGCATCDVPTGLVSTVLSPVKVNLSWSAVLGATKYKISYRPSTGGAWINTNATATSKNISGLTPGTTYQWKVKTVCGALFSAFSPINVFTTPLKEAREITTTPSVLIYPNPSENQFSVSISGFDKNVITVSLYAVNGEVVFSQTHNTESAAYLLLETDAAAGLYLLRVSDDQHSISTKLILE